MYTKRQILVGVIVLFIAIGSLGYFRYYKTHYYLKIPKVTNLPSNESSSASPGYAPMWALEDAQEMVNWNKKFVENGLKNTSTNEYIVSTSISLLYHKANDIAGVWGTYNDDQSLNDSVSDIYKYYDLRPDCINLNPRLLLKDLDKQYFIEASPQQQRTIIQKALEMDVFEMENPIDWVRFCYKREKKHRLYDKAFVESDWIALQIAEVVYLNNTPKNKATIDAYIKWLEDNYLPELLKNPVDRWPWDW